MSYNAPVKDMLFVLKELAGIDTVAQLPGFEDAGYDTAQAVLDESAKFCGEVLAPLNVEGDRNPSSWKDGVVTATPGFGEAFRQFVEGGWQGLQHPSEYDGQGLPKLIATPCIEMLNAANLSFALCPLLTDGAIEALLTAGTDEQKQRYVPKLISGEWTGTMNLTEPQAGSISRWCVRAPSRRATARTRCSARRSSSRGASTTWRTTSSTWCWHARRTRRKA